LEGNYLEQNERKRLFANLIRDLILHGKIVTSKAKAKAVQPLMEKLVTRAKKGSDSDRRLILKTISDGAVVDTLCRDVKDRFTTRTSGYTRMIKIGNIRSDGSEEVMLSFVDEAIKREPITYVKTETKEKAVKTENESKPIKKETKKSVKKTKIVKK
jgi:large subunit ribosomal protein L17